MLNRISLIFYLIYYIYIINESVHSEMEMDDLQL